MDALLLGFAILSHGDSSLVFQWHAPLHIRWVLVRDPAGKRPMRAYLTTDIHQQATSVIFQTSTIPPDLHLFSGYFEAFSDYPDVSTDLNCSRVLNRILSVACYQLVNVQSRAKHYRLALYSTG